MYHHLDLGPSKSHYRQVPSSASIPRGKVLEVTQEVTHTKAGARRFAGVGGSNALLGGSNAESQ